MKFLIVTTIVVAIFGITACTEEVVSKPPPVTVPSKEISPFNQTIVMRELTTIVREHDSVRSKDVHFALRLVDRDITQLFDEYVSDGYVKNYDIVSITDYVGTPNIAVIVQYNDAKTDTFHLVTVR